MSFFICRGDQILSGNLSAMPVGCLVKNLRWFKAGVPREGCYTLKKYICLALANTGRICMFTGG